jgi:hypothetical protein
MAHIAHISYPDSVAVPNADSYVQLFYIYNYFWRWRGSNPSPAKEIVSHVADGTCRWAIVPRQGVAHLSDLSRCLIVTLVFLLSRSCCPPCPNVPQSHSPSAVAAGSMYLQRCCPVEEHDQSTRTHQPRRQRPDRPWTVRRDSHRQVPDVSPFLDLSFDLEVTTGPPFVLPVTTFRAAGTPR